MRQWTGSSLNQVIACRLFGANPLPEPMLAYCQLDSWEQTSVKFESQLCHFYSKKFIWKCRLSKFSPGGDKLKRHNGAYGFVEKIVVLESQTVFESLFQTRCPRQEVVFQNGSEGGIGRSVKTAESMFYVSITNNWLFIARVWPRSQGLPPVAGAYWETNSMGWCKKDVTPLLTHWSYVFLALTHRFVFQQLDIICNACVIPSAASISYISKCAPYITTTKPILVSQCMSYILF